MYNCKYKITQNDKSPIWGYAVYILLSYYYLLLREPSVVLCGMHEPTARAQYLARQH
jgi:hypothetical protein